MINRNYFSNTSLSNSALSTINPNQGGSPKDYLDFFSSDREFKTSLSLERGNLVHLYCENKDEFIISDIEKPSDMMCKWVETMFSGLKRNGLPPSALDDEFICFTKQTLDIYSNIKDKEKIAAKFKAEGKVYFDFLVNAEGKIAMTKATAEIIKACIDSLHKHPISQHLLFEKPGFGNEEYFNELEIYWKEIVEVRIEGNLRQVEIPCKAKIDRLMIDYDTFVIRKPDIKTTSKPKSKFQESFEYYHYYRQHAFYRLAVKRWLENARIDLRDQLSKFKVFSYNVIVETVNNNQVGVVPISNYWLDKGREEVKSLLQRVAWHIETKQWDMSLEEYNSNGYLLLKDEVMY